MFARTERLLLRPSWCEDAPMIEALARSERKVRDLFGRQPACDLDRCRQSADLPLMLVMRRTSGAPELIGIAGLVRKGGRDAELLCWIARPQRGQGYGTEAARAVLHIAEHGLRLKRVRSPYSGRASSFPERLGFKGDERVFGAEGEIDEAVEAQAA